MYQKILVPLDGSSIAEGVLPHVKEVAKKFDAEILLLQTVPSMSQILLETAATTMEGSVSGAELGVEVADQQYTAIKHDAESYLGSVADRLKAEGLRATKYIVEGSAAAAILEFAKESKVDLIAMSTHGRGGLGRLVFGSVTDEVLRKGPHLPMLLIRGES